jgi:hypothetical protein
MPRDSEDAASVIGEIDIFVHGGPRGLEGSSFAGRNAPLIWNMSATSNSRSTGNIPNKNTKGLLVTHVHEQRANKKAQTLTIPNLVIVQAKAFQHST